MGTASFWPILVAILSAAALIVWVLHQVRRLSQLERSLKDERDYRRKLQDDYYELLRETRQAYEVMGLKRELSTPARWVKS